MGSVAICLKVIVEFSEEWHMLLPLYSKKDVGCALFLEGPHSSDERGNS